MATKFRCMVDTGTLFLHCLFGQLNQDSTPPRQLILVLLLRLLLPLLPLHRRYRHHRSQLCV